MSDDIKNRLIKENVPFKANDSISDYLSDNDRNTIRKNVHDAVEQLLDALVIDRHNDHNTNETAKRVSKMYVDEVFRGRYYPMPTVTEFPNVKQLDELYTVGPITVRSFVVITLYQY